MKKLFLLSIIAVFAISNVNAQEVKFGAKAGVNLANIGGDTEDNKAIVAFHVGGVAEISISEKFAVQPELLFSSQGTKFEESGDKLTYNLGYINIPIMAKYEVADGFSVQAGPQVGFLVSAKAKFDFEGESGTEDIKDEFETLDFGAGFGVGYEMPTGLFFSARYNLGFSNLAKDSEGDFKANNNVVQVSVGWMF